MREAEKLIQKKEEESRHVIIRIAFPIKPVDSLGNTHLGFAREVILHSARLQDQGFRFWNNEIDMVHNITARTDKTVGELFEDLEKIRQRGQRKITEELDVMAWYGVRLADPPRGRGARKR